MALVRFTGEGLKKINTIKDIDPFVIYSMKTFRNIFNNEYFTKWVLFFIKSYNSTRNSNTSCISTTSKRPLRGASCTSTFNFLKTQVYVHTVGLTMHQSCTAHEAQGSHDFKWNHSKAFRPVNVSSQTDVITLEISAYRDELNFPLPHGDDGTNR